MGSMVVPSFTLDPSTKELHFASRFHVKDLPAWEAFLQDLMRKGKSEWRIVGRARIKALGLTFHDIPFDKTVDIEAPPLPGQGRGGGVDQEGFIIRQMDLSSSDSDKIRIKIDIDFHNPSTSAIESLGFLQFLMLYEQTPIGILRSSAPVGLQRGLNSYTFLAEIYPDVQSTLQAQPHLLSSSSQAKTILGGGKPAAKDERKEEPRGKNSLAQQSFSSSSEGGGGGASSHSRRLAETPAFSSSSLGGGAGGGRFERMKEKSEEDEEQGSFRRALSEIMSKSLSGSEVHVRTVGLHSSQPLFSSAVRAMSVETPVDDVFDDDEEDEEEEDSTRPTEEQEERAEPGSGEGTSTLIAKEERRRKRSDGSHPEGGEEEKKRKRMIKRKAGLVKEMRFDGFELSASDEEESSAATNRANVVAKVTVRFLNPLGANSRLDIQQVRVLLYACRRGWTLYLSTYLQLVG